MKRILMITTVLATLSSAVFGYTGFMVGDTSNSKYAHVVNMNGAIFTRSFTSKTTNTTLRTVRITNINTAYAAGDNGELITTVNSGASWTELTSGITDTIWGIDASPITATVVFACGSNSAIIKSTDAGASWSAQTAPVVKKSLRAIRVLDDTTAYIVGSDTTIMKTIDGGTTWTSVHCVAGISGILRSIDFYGTTGYACGSRGIILKCINGAWTKQTVGSSENLVNINMISATSAYCASDSIDYPASWGKYFKSTDGVSWSGKRVPINGTEQILWQKTIDQFNAYVISNSPLILTSVLYYTNNGGASWDDVKTFAQKERIKSFDVLIESAYDNRYISTLFSAQTIDSTFTYYTPWFLMDRYGWFGVYGYTTGTSPKIRVTFEGAPTLSDTPISPADSVLFDSLGTISANDWRQLNSPPGKLGRFKCTGLSGNSSNTTITIKLYSWGF